MFLLKAEVDTFDPVQVLDLGSFADLRSAIAKMDKLIASITHLQGIMFVVDTDRDNLYVAIQEF